jgi:hypothetical protein
MRVIVPSHEKSKKNEQDAGGKKLNCPAEVYSSQRLPIRANRLLERKWVHYPAGHNREGHKRAQKNKEIF